MWTTPRYKEALAFFRDVLNFAESDSIGEGVTFFRAFPNPYHHGGVARGERNKLHHVNFMVMEIDDVGRGLARFKAKDVPIVFGPGRHPASTSIFLMEEFSEANPRRPRSLEPLPLNVDSWGSVRDPRMAAVGEIASGEIVSAGKPPEERQPA